MTGLRAFSYKFVKTFPVMSKGFELETEMTIHCLDKNLKVKNVIIEYRDRPADSPSKLNTIPDGIRVIKTIFGFYKNYKPLNFFSIISFIIAIIGLIFFIPAVIVMFKTGEIKVPSIILSMLLFVCTLQSIFTGLTLDNIIQNSKQNFEMRLIDCEKDLKTRKENM